MPTTAPTTGFVQQLPPALFAGGLVVVTALLLVIAGRRLGLLCFALQYPLLAALVLLPIYPPLALVMTGLGLGVSAILYVTAAQRRRQPQWFSASATGRDLIARFRASPSGDMGLGFRLVVMAFGAVVAYGLARTLPLQGVLADYGFVFYQLMVAGLLVSLTSIDPLRRGYGLLTLMHGFQGIYLQLEQSFLVFALWSSLEILAALAVAYFGQMWLDAWREEEGA